MRALLSLLILGLLAGCSSRARDNPFDPQNPSTHGGPAGFVAVADDGRVELQWTPEFAAGFSGYRLYRQAGADTTFRPITNLLPPGTTHHSDIGLLNGLDHHYRLAYVFPEGERGIAEDVATPGPARPWVVDSGSAALYRLTPDARRIAAVRGGFSYPSSVAADPVSGLVWISDNGAGNLVQLNPWTGTLVTLTNFAGPSTLALDPSTHDVWMCDESHNTVYEFSPAAIQVGSPLDPIDTPIGVAVDPVDGSVWICERGGNRIRHYDAGHTLLGSVDLEGPSRVAVDSVTRSVWVTSFGSRQVFRVTAGVRDRTIGGLGGPIGIAVDSRRGKVWVADALGNAVLLMDRTGALLARVENVGAARDISVDPVTGDAWVAAPGSGAIVRISTSGTSVRRLGGFDSPVGIAVDPGVR
jgi:DNA-binding beta-propeller fold protein YncE